MTQRDLSGRLARWSLKLQGFDFTIDHRRGKDNIVPDALSRIYCDDITEQLSDVPIDFQSPEFKDKYYIDLLDSVKANQDRLPDLEIKDGFLQALSILLWESIGRNRVMEVMGTSRSNEATN